MSTHYQLLSEGDTIQEGDEYWDGEGCDWMAIESNDVGRKNDWLIPIRRPLGSDTCDHIVGFELDWDYTRLWSRSNGRMIAGPNNTIFNFCSLCGKPLTKEDRG